MPTDDVSYIAVHHVAHEAGALIQVHQGDGEGDAAGQSGIVAGPVHGEGVHRASSAQLPPFPVVAQAVGAPAPGVEEEPVAGAALEHQASLPQAIEVGRSDGSGGRQRPPVG